MNMKIMDQYDFYKFFKIKRKYYKRHCVRRVNNINGKRFVSYWEKEDWIGYIISSYLTYSSDEFERQEVRSLIGSELYEATLNTVKELYNNIWGQYKFSFNYKNEEKNTYIGYFIGVILTNRDAYFLASDKQYSKSKKDYQLVPMWWNAEKI